MAEVVTGALSTLLPKLGDLLKEEYELQKSVRGGITFLKNELERMQAALLEISEATIYQPPNRLVKLWARDVRELTYDIEDSIDKFMVRIDTHAPNKLHGLKGFLDRSLNLLTKTKIRRKIGTEIEDIKTRVKDVSELRDRYKVDKVVAKPVCPTIDSLRLSALYKKATELVGIEEKSDGLIKRLMEGDEASKQQLKIVSIVGFGGIGKTTLANVVYQKLKVEFNCGAFVSVSLNPNMEKIFKNMLHQLDEDKYSSINEATRDQTQLINELREFLQHKRYFIVLDDIWDTSVWEVIKYAFVENEYGSKIIITTRNLDVAKQVGGIYPLEQLSFVDSRKLFLQRIFGVEDECPSQLAEVSKKILKKCGGVPLAIITIASLLASKKEKENTQKYWSKVYQSIGKGLDDSLDVNNMRKILYISYYDLPPHLKNCLLYLSLYPEDYNISSEDLIWKWVGEGFVHNEQGKSLREVGGDYLDELINKSLIQPGDFSTDNKAIITCCVHDMVLDLITFLLKEGHFLTALGRQQPVPVPSKIRRLSLQTSNKDDVKQLSTLDLSHVRSLTVFDKKAFSLLPALSSFQVLRALNLSYCKQVENHHCKDICSLFHLRYLVLCGTSVSEIPKEIGNLRFLQVLDISGIKIKELPSTFVQLRQLVYLVLRGTFVNEIPKEIGNLQFLQVLDISWTNIKELPSTFVQLTQLVYLDVRRWTSLPDGFGNLKCLQELRAISIRSPTMLHELGRLTELRRLEIKFDEWDERYEEPFLRCLSNLASLEILEMESCIVVYISENLSRCENLSQQLRYINVGMGIGRVAVPRWMSSLSSLLSLHIRLETVGVGNLRFHRSIPSLCDEVIWAKGPIQGSDYPFQCQTIAVVFAQEAMKKLQTLELKFVVRQTIDRFGDLVIEKLSSLGHVSVAICGHGGCEGCSTEITGNESQQPHTRVG